MLVCSSVFECLAQRFWCVLVCSSVFRVPRSKVLVRASVFEYVRVPRSKVLGLGSDANHFSQSDRDVCMRVCVCVHV